MSSWRQIASQGLRARMTATLRAVQAAMGMLEEAGFTPIVCHAQGKGDKAMEEMIRDGMFQGLARIDVARAQT